MADNLNLTPGQIGIIVKNAFINDKKTFINLFKQDIAKNSKEIREAAINLQKALQVVKALDNKDPNNELAGATSEMYKCYKEFESRALLRPAGADVQMGFRDSKGKYYLLSDIEAEQYNEFVESSNKRRVNFGIANNRLYTNARKKSEARTIQKLILHHLNEMMDTISGTNDEGKITDQAYDDMKKRCGEKMVHFRRKDGSNPNTFGYYLLADTTDKDGNYILNPSQSGQAYEAYFDHLARQHKWVYDFLASKGAINGTAQEIMTRDRSVYKEEGGTTTGVGNFANLLAEARGNNTPWFASGDIVIVNPETGEIVYNIQLKTTKLHETAGFAQSIDELLKFIGEFIDTDGDAEKMAELIWNSFKTTLTGTSNQSTNSIGEAVTNEAEQLVADLEKFGVKKA